ncbi:hypothetical protein BGZ76_004373 [Entomortierella beljakovae]|nr:hypothetical protein BGZ76_004373 [Entomortierella beljakovae]
MKVNIAISMAISMFAMASVSAEPSLARPVTDPCSDLAAQAQNSNSTLKYETVRDCFNGFEFNQDIADKTVDALYTMIDKFYIFKDLAKAPTKAPFKTARVDLLASLNKIKAKKWKRDYDFKNAIYVLFNSVNDGHLKFADMCYATVQFIQPIQLYAPVENGRQTARVFQVSPEASELSHTVDCTVTHIDGAPALKVIQDYADFTGDGLSKDPGVRLNHALASVSWDGKWKVDSGGFAKRHPIPKKSTVEYTIKCSKAASKKFTVPWTAIPFTESPIVSFPFNGFNDTQSYWSNICLVKGASVQQHKRELKDDILGQKPILSVRGVSANPRTTVAVPPLQFKHAKEVYTSSLATFYTLNESNACVVVIAHEDATYPDDYNALIDGLVKLRDTGCKKLIFHLATNTGGSIDFAYFINLVIFPDSNPYLPNDIRAGPYIRGLGKLATSISSPDGEGRRYNSSENLIFDARRFNSSLTGLAYKDDTMFTNYTLYKRGGTTDAYSERFYFDHNWSMLPLPKEKTLPWKASDMAIFSNGVCVHQKVKTFAIGGIHKRPLSYMTYPGGYTNANHYLVQMVQQYGYNATGGPTNMPIQAIAYFPMAEFYLNNASTTPLEFDSQHFAAQVHLDYSTETARQPDAIWVKIAAELNK